MTLQLPYTTKCTRTAAPQRRLAALNVLAQLPEETPLGDTIARAVLQSCFDAEASIADAGLRCGRLSDAINIMTDAEARIWFTGIVEVLKTAEDDVTRSNIADTIYIVSQTEEGRAALIAAGACAALV